MGPCVASVESNGALIAAISGGGETMSVIPVSNATNLNGVGAGMVGWQRVGSDTAETSSTTTVINATTHAARVGDALVFTGGTAGNLQVWSVVSAVTANTITLANALPATPANGDAFNILRPVTIGAGAAGSSNAPSLNVNIDSNTQLSTATGILKQEDVAAGSGDAGVAMFGIRNTNMTTLANADLDYIGINANAFGALYVDLNTDARQSTLRSPLKPEDEAFADTGALMMAGAQSVSVIAQTVGATGDVAPLAVDLGNRLVTTNAPAGETWSTCTSTISSATNTSVKALVASNRIYVTSFSCTALDTTPNVIYVTDGSAGTALDIMQTVSNAVGIGPDRTYPTPLRLTSATALFVTTGTAGNVRCCAAGYISTI